MAKASNRYFMYIVNYDKRHKVTADIKKGMIYDLTLSKAVAIINRTFKSKAKLWFYLYERVDYDSKTILGLKNFQY